MMRTNLLFYPYPVDAIQSHLSYSLPYLLPYNLCHLLYFSLLLVCGRHLTDPIKKMITYLLKIKILLQAH